VHSAVRECHIVNFGPDDSRLGGKAQSNSSGNFIVSVPEGGYVVHVMTVDFPFCPEESVTVAVHNFSLTQINCDTGIR
jgi:hypothetical protein